MLSILIPVYNVDVTKLVEKLYKQCRQLGIVFEILVFDDLSNEKYRSKNSGLSGMFGVNYLELSQNLGRAKIRNWLLKSASFDYILYLDSDSKVISNNFIKTYVESKDTADILCGGRVYSKKPPRASSKFLHWKYGTQCESKSAKVRNKDIINYFHTNNIFGLRKVFEYVPFHQDHDGYGYEDLVFAQEVNDAGFSIKHIENPVQHLGLETQIQFLAKTKQSIQNLVIYEQKGLLHQTRLQKFATLSEGIQVDQFLKKFLAKFETQIISNIKSKTPSMIALSLWKLYEYWKIKK